MRELLFSLSKSNGDFIIDYFNGQGKGGQNRNKREMACRIHHSKSGALATCQEERSQEQNRKRAFQRLCKTPKFVSWLNNESQKYLGVYKELNSKVDGMMKDIKVEVQLEGTWVEISI